VIIIKKKRLAAGFRQVDICKKIGASQSGYSAIESGKRIPTLKKLIKLAQIYNCTVDDLLDQQEVEN